MADTQFASTMSRAHWAGSTADRDVHIAAYEGLIDGSFQVQSMFRTGGLTTFKAISGTNVWRGDRVGGATVKGRRSGQQLDTTRIINDKYTITVDTTVYIRSAIDFQDDWTGPDFKSEYSAEHATAHAKSFDQAHIIQLIKCGEWLAPAELKASGAFYDGILATAEVAALTTNKEKAAKWVQEHKGVMAEFVKRDLGDSLQEAITLVTPDLFNLLLDDDKLMNVDFQGPKAENDYARRRIAWLNGIRVIETPRIPTAAISDHPLGDAYDLTAAQAKARMIVFFPRKALITVEAMPMSVQVWEDRPNWANVIDSYAMYVVGVRRGDVVAVIRTDE